MSPAGAAPLGAQLTWARALHALRISRNLEFYTASDKPLPRKKTQQVGGWGGV